MLSGAAIRASLPSGKQKKSHRELDDLFRIQTTVIGVAFDSCCYDKGAPFFQVIIISSIISIRSETNQYRKHFAEIQLL